MLATTQINVQSLPPSIYLVQIFDANGTVEQLRIVKTGQ
jgi:hypothetical protein